MREYGVVGVVAFLFSLACSCGKPVPVCEGCAGCCSAGQCEVGITQSACGSGGQECNSCGASQLCQLGACVTAADDAGPGDAGSRDIIITGTQTAYLEAGPRAAPANLTATAIGVQVELADGGWRKLAATSLDAGLSSIANVPAGRTFLTYGPDVFIDTSASTIDLSFSSVGRADVQYAASSTPLTLNFTGLEAWAPYEYFSVAALNAGVFLEPVLASTPAIPLGSTSGAGTFDWAANPFPLIDASRGDVSIISQHSARTVGTVLYRAISRAATVNSLTLRSGQASTLPVALMPVSPTVSLDVDWQAPAWEALTPQTGAAGTFYRQILSLHALPAASNGLLVSPGLVFLGALPGAAAVQGRVSWGNPFPAAWPVIVYQRAYYSQRVVALGLESNWVEMAFEATELGPPSGALQPRLGPPKAVLINGEDANANLAGVGLTPTVSWSAPALGAPTRYHLVFIQATVSGGQLQLVPIAQLLTKATSVRLPPGIIPAGSTCVLWVGAESWGTNDLERRPFDADLPARSIGTLTQPFTP